MSLYDRTGGAVPLSSGVANAATRRDLKRIYDELTAALTRISDLETAVSALEAAQVIEIDGTYTPTLVGMAIGTGGSALNQGRYTYVGTATEGLLVLDGEITFGTSGTTFPAATITFSLPSGYTMAGIDDALNIIGDVLFIDADSTDMRGHLRWDSSSTVRIVLEQTGSGTGTNNIAIVGTSTTDPFTFAAGDGFEYHLALRVNKA